MLVRNTVRLAEWYWRICRAPYGVLCAVFAVQQMGILMIQASRKANVGCGYTELYLNSLQRFAFLVALVIAAVLACRALWQSDGKSKAGYTLLTLPMPRGTLLAGNILLCAVLIVGVAALQVVLFVVGYFPVRALSGAVCARLTGGTPEPAAFYVELAINPVMQALLPAGTRSALDLLLALTAVSVSVPCVFVHRRTKRVGAGILAALACAAAGGEMQLTSNYGLRAGYISSTGWGLPVCAAVLTAANLIWALNALRRSELA